LDGAMFEAFTGRNPAAEFERFARILKPSKNWIVYTDVIVRDFWNRQPA